MNPLFQSAYEGSQAVEGEVEEAAAWSQGAGGWELGAGPGGGSPWESARAVCVFCTAAHCGWGEAGPCKPSHHPTNPQGREEE